MVHRLLEAIALGLRKGKLLTSDELQLITLLLLEEKPRHGYEIIKAVEEHSKGIYTPSPGMIYPVLTFLEELGYAEPQAEGTKKLFHLTAEGTRHLDEHRDEATDVLRHLAAYGEKMASFHEQMNDDDQWGGDQEKKEYRKLKHEFFEAKHELKDALMEKRTASLEEKKRVLKVLRNCIAEIRKP